MTEHKNQTERSDKDEGAPNTESVAPMVRFKDLARRIVAVPRSDITRLECLAVGENNCKNKPNQIK